MSHATAMYATLLRRELCLRNARFAGSFKLAHVTSHGEMPVVVYRELPEQRRHGNFLDSTYGAILDRRAWKRRLDKVHSQGSRSLPRSDQAWKELDSSMSSDALLMNVFCHAGTLTGGAVASMLGIERDAVPDFGFRARVPLTGGRVDRTEVDMKLGRLLVEAKLTEADFQVGESQIVEAYRDLEQVFHRRQLPQAGKRYISYQLIRNVLAAYALDLDFCVLLDARRPDLIEAWYAIMKCVRLHDLRTRCKVLTWQEVSEALSPDLQDFLDLKYGIVPPGKSPSVCGEPEI